jgi:hypothetical protein
MEPAERRRRIDRVTDPAYLEGLSEHGLPELRAMRDDCREEEARLSYARRVAQGQADIARAEQRRRQGEGGDDDSLVAALTEILADAPAPGSREARSMSVYSGEDGLYGARAHDTLVDDGTLSRVPELSDDELAELLERLVAKETQISALRRTVLDHLDALSAELVDRYRDGSVDVDAIVAGAVGESPGDDD